VTAVDEQGRITAIKGITAPGGDFPQNVKTVNGVAPDENGNVNTFAPTEEQVSSAVSEWLDEHPEATTTVEDGSITEEKLSEDLKENLVKAASSANITALTMQVVGQLFAKPEERKYVAWALGNVQYDSADDTVNVLVNAATKHSVDDGMLDLYLFKMNPHTLDYALEPIVKDGVVTNQTNDVPFAVGSKGAYVYGFCVDSNGDYLFMPNYCDEAYLFRSNDHGTSWTVAVCNMPNRNDTAFTGLMQTYTGRLIVSTHSSYFWYSDDNGANWTKCATPTSHGAGHEACIVELAENELIAVMRKRWQSTHNNSWNGTREIDPAFICYSHDNGETWTNGVDSKTITEMSASGCAIAKIGDRLELYATSRYPHLDTMGVIYQHAASVKDAMADNWSNGKVLTYAKAKSYDDFGYPGCCVDGTGNVHLVWYDGDADERGNTNYYYAQGYSGVCNIPLNADSLRITSSLLPYSAKMVESLINAAVAKLNARINQIIIDGGGTPEPDGGLDGTFYVIDGLYESVNFLDESKYNASTYTYSGVNGKFDIVAGQNKPSEFSTKGLHQTGYQKANLSADLPFENGVTFELEIYVDENADSGATPQVIAVCVNNNIYGKPGFTNAGTLVSSYTKTDGSTGEHYSQANQTLRIYGDTNRYKHIVMTVSDIECCGYVEGVLVNRFTWADIEDFASLFVNAVSTFSVNGSWGTTGNYAQCLRVYNRALTADEVNNNYTYQKALRE
jgi:hypothetical protein